jgi:hypothetical protein
MNFNESNMCPCDAEPIPQATLSELMNKAYCMGNEALAMTMIINRNLFGDKRDRAEGVERGCYRDVAQEHCNTLESLCNELRTIIDLLGCKE